MKKTFSWLIRAVSLVYLAALFAWLAAYLASGDRFPALALVNLVAVYLFFPVPLVLLAGLLLRRVEIWGGSLLALAVFFWLWGGLLLPQARAARAGGKTLVVMTYNVLGHHAHTEPPIDTIRSENPDIVLLQEVNPALAEAIQTELASEYPYQVLDPQRGVTGMGVISRYPLAPTGYSLPLNWIGTPQVLTLEWDGRQATVVNFHMQSSTPGSVDRLDEHNRLRQAQAQALLDLAGVTGPLIVAGDANATPLSDAYRILDSGLTDAWIEAGFGLGHTFPGSAIPGSSRPQIAGVYLPQWLLRIDYIWHSAEWHAVEAHTADFDGVSDHRGVVATLTISKAGDQANK